MGFKKGQSGNPGGRPKEVAHVRELAREHTDEAIKALVDVMQRDPKGSARVAAAVAILDRAYGKAPQPIDASVDLSRKSLSELLQQVPEAIAALQENLKDNGET